MNLTRIKGVGCLVPSVKIPLKLKVFHAFMTGRKRLFLLVILFACSFIHVLLSASCFLSFSLPQVLLFSLKISKRNQSKNRSMGSRLIPSFTKTLADGIGYMKKKEALNCQRPWLSLGCSPQHQDIGMLCTEKKGFSIPKEIS